MTIVSSAALAAFTADAAVRWPEEACGVVTAAGYVALPNLAADPLIDFVLPADAWIAHGPVVAVLHSHTHSIDRKTGALVARPNDFPSIADQQAQPTTAVAWGIACVTSSATGEIHVGEPFFFGDQAEIPPLIGRPFRHAVTDCYALVRDFFRLRGVTIPNFVRDDEWWNAGGDLYREHFAEAGFHEIPQAEIREGDCFIARVHTPVPAHAGVYLGDGLVLHHLRGRLSRRDPFTAAVGAPRADRWLRHESLA
jgi:cell wall-associated NlpC family hydrolase